MEHVLTLWTNDPQIAGWADRASVDRIGLDLETRGKAERQRGLPTWISPHKFADLREIRPQIRRARLFVRTNPLHADSRGEIESLLGEGAAILMLPNFRRREEVAEYAALVAGRAQIVPLLERVDAIDAIASFPALGIGEMHVGLNDLSIDLGLPNRLAVLAAPIMDRIAAAARAASIRLGVGGLGRALDADLPVPSDLVYAAQIRLGATGALLARSFFSPDMTEERFAAEIASMRARLREWRSASMEDLEVARRKLARYAGAAPENRGSA